MFLFLHLACYIVIKCLLVAIEASSPRKELKCILLPQHKLFAEGMTTFNYICISYSIISSYYRTLIVNQDHLHLYSCSNFHVMKSVVLSDQSDSSLAAGERMCELVKVVCNSIITIQIFGARVNLNVQMPKRALVNR